jgi:hypothetical protein
LERRRRELIHAAVAQQRFVVGTRRFDGRTVDIHQWPAITHAATHERTIPNIPNIPTKECVVAGNYSRPGRYFPQNRLA